MKCEPKLPQDPEQDVPRHRGADIDDDGDDTPGGDEVPETPPTEPEPVPVTEPPPPPEKRGPFVV